mmetsp:Transcript_48570/g.137890  ORF Transcript_48570/g.137890 Transcript_48570/m.137890 type:complete len:83 (-) Transcript_48570:12-260(-)
MGAIVTLPSSSTNGGKKGSCCAGPELDALAAMAHTGERGAATARLKNFPEARAAPENIGIADRPPSVRRSKSAPKQMPVLQA